MNIAAKQVIIFLRQIYFHPRSGKFRFIEVFEKHLDKLKFDVLLT